MRQWLCFDKIYCKIWRRGKWLSLWTQPLIITLPEKGNLQLCQNYRTIRLMSHLNKVIMKVVLNRPNQKRYLLMNRLDSQPVEVLKLYPKHIWPCHKKNKNYKSIQTHHLNILGYQSSNPSMKYYVLTFSHIWPCRKKSQINQRSLYQVPDSTYQVSRPLVDWFQRRKCWKAFTFYWHGIYVVMWPRPFGQIFVFSAPKGSTKIWLQMAQGFLKRSLKFSYYV